jgi:DNA-binding CsgD family transcriptional regulator
MAGEPGVLVLDVVGAICGASHGARRTLRAAGDADLRTSLRALHTRATMAGAERPVVGEVRLAGGGRALLTAVWADRHLTVVVQEESDGGALALPPDLTARELEIAELIAQGLPTKRIATLLGISVWTVTAHLQAIFGKAGVSSRGELLALMLSRARRAG